MKIAFHAPLKSPDHTVPSGDRLMARLFIAALVQAGHGVETASVLRTFMKEPSADALQALESEAEAEIGRLSALWQHRGAPDLWFTYHPYYKAPDLIGPKICGEFGIPYVTAEASYSARRNAGAWSKAQSYVLDAVGQAAVNICLTGRDRDGLVQALPGACTAMLPPFLDAAAFLAITPNPRPDRLIAVAMMRAGDKMDSYRMLADALTLLPDLPWTLSIVGDGPCRAETQALFARFTTDRILWYGEKSQGEIAALMSESALYVWPGCGEAYGLAYLEAQAAGLPVVAQAIAGVPEVVDDGRTGILTPSGDTRAYANAIRHLLTCSVARIDMSRNARRMVDEKRSLDKASKCLAAILNDYAGTKRGH